MAVPKLSRRYGTSWETLAGRVRADSAVARGAAWRVRSAELAPRATPPVVRGVLRSDDGAGRCGGRGPSRSSVDRRRAAEDRRRTGARVRTRGGEPQPG